MKTRNRLAAALLCAVTMGAGTNVNAQTTQFFDDFSPNSNLSSKWDIATWANGHPFGCTFSSQNVSKNQGLLKLSFSGSSGKCAEVRTKQFWQYGQFVVDMKPSNVNGTVSSFFLYDGVAGTSSHFEIDIEFVGGTSLLHTNYWVSGQQFPVDIDLTALGIDPYASSRKYSFVWQPNAIIWYVADNAGQWIEVRRASVNISAPMKLMMNAWYGDNINDALYFPGYYNGTPGQAVYDSVWIGS